MNQTPTQPPESTVTAATNAIEQEEHYLESPSKRKCPRCKQQLIHRTCGTAKFAGQTALLAYDYCLIHGQPPVTKHQLKLAALVSNIKPLVKPSINTSDG